MGERFTPDLLTEIFHLIGDYLQQILFIFSIYERAELSGWESHVINGDQINCIWGLDAAQCFMFDALMSTISGERFTTGLIPNGCSPYHHPTEQ